MTTSQISIRIARQDDYADLWRVATLDSALVHEGPLLVAESDGEIVAALSLTNGGVIADPFRRTAELVDLLRAHGAAKASAERRRRGVNRVRRPRLALSV